MLEEEQISFKLPKMVLRICHWGGIKNWFNRLQIFTLRFTTILAYFAISGYVKIEKKFFFAHF